MGAAVVWQPLLMLLTLLPLLVVLVLPTAALLLMVVSPLVAPLAWLPKLTTVN
jgi:hypothetical protein